ncbi:S49 family peptidase [Granulosicoccus sp.]|nr:S49 family peptidase [Granulosicoccus sp.]MDB4223971.1 S49 family peptidase [Granulosicoccus sp.]
MTDFNDADSPTRLLHELARESLVERRRARRWSIFFRTVTLLLVLGVIFALLRDSNGLGLSTQSGDADDGHTAVIRIEGVIAPGSPASIEPVSRSLERAFADKNTRGILLHVNSPGGSPVQSGLVYDAIVKLRTAHPDVPVHAVLGDVAASGGYYVAAAAENIYANRASIVGSIGVRLDSFGAVDAMDRLGIERRLLTSGEHKGMLDPFEPVDDVAVARLQSVLDNVHAQFIEAVKEGRGARLDSDPQLFSGLVWSGEEALDNGLVDALASTHEVARDVIGAKNIVDFTELGDPLTRLRRELGASISVLFKNTLRTLLGGNADRFLY